jgi:hypothetical protein
MKHHQFSERDTLDTAELPTVLFIEYLSVSEQRKETINQPCYNVTRYTSSGIIRICARFPQTGFETP